VHSSCGPWTRGVFKVHKNAESCLVALWDMYTAPGAQSGHKEGMHRGREATSGSGVLHVTPSISHSMTLLLVTKVVHNRWHCDTSETVRVSSTHVLFQ
jgi:hypothetical protein